MSYYAVYYGEMCCDRNLIIIQYYSQAVLTPHMAVVSIVLSELGGGVGGGGGGTLLI